MPKEIKQCYQHMDISFSSTVEEIKEREKVMIKLLRAKAIKKKKSYNNQINKVVNSANNILDYINKNGIPNVTDSLFETPLASIITQIVVVIAFAIISICSINALI